MMDRVTIAEFFEKRDRAWQEHDTETLSASHTENGEIDSPLFGVLKGQEAIRKSYADWFRTFPDTEYHVRHLLIDGDRAAEFIRITATQQYDVCGYKATGKRFDFNGSSMFLLSEGRIAREIRTYDFTGVLVQLGALKAKPSF